MLCRQRWRGDLRRLHAEAGADPVALRRLLTGFPGIGPTGADIFLREVQRVWTDLRPFADRRVLSAPAGWGCPRMRARCANWSRPGSSTGLSPR